MQKQTTTKNSTRLCRNIALPQHISGVREREQKMSLSQNCV